MIKVFNFLCLDIVYIPVYNKFRHYNIKKSILNIIGINFINKLTYSPMHVTFSVKNLKKSETYPNPGHLCEPT